MRVWTVPLPSGTATGAASHTSTTTRLPGSRPCRAKLARSSSWLGGRSVQRAVRLAGLAALVLAGRRVGRVDEGAHDLALGVEAAVALAGPGPGGLEVERAAGSGRVRRLDEELEGDQLSRERTGRRGGGRRWGRSGSRAGGRRSGPRPGGRPWGRRPGQAAAGSHGWARRWPLRCCTGTSSPPLHRLRPTRATSPSTNTAETATTADRGTFTRLPVGANDSLPASGYGHRVGCRARLRRRSPQHGTGPRNHRGHPGPGPVRAAATVAAAWRNQAAVRLTTRGNGWAMRAGGVV